MALLGLEAAADADCEADEEGHEGCGPDGVGVPIECWLDLVGNGMVLVTGPVLERCSR
jgi:hypothetical protein